MRIGQLLQIGFFLVFIFGGMLLILAFGGMKTVSETENRALAALPKWSQQAALSGDYFRGFENYVADHVAFRDKLVDASMTVASGGDWLERMIRLSLPLMQITVQKMHLSTHQTSYSCRNPPHQTLRLYKPLRGKSRIILKSRAVSSGKC